MGNCPTCSLEITNTHLDPLCNGERMWTIFLLSSCVILVGGWVIILIFELLKKLLVNYRRRRLPSKIKNIRYSHGHILDDEAPLDRNFNWLNEMKDWINSFITGKTKMGKTFVTIIFLCSIASLILYCIDTKNNTYVESCTAFYDSLSMQIDLGLNSIFLIHFILRFAVAAQKRRCWFGLYSLVDIFTIPPSFIAVYLNRSWIGLRFLRVVPLKNIPDLLQYMNVIERPETIRIVRLASKFTAILFATAGAIHLAENSGDFFCNFCNAQEINIFNALYYMVITMTTVGYGDISCKTYIGKTCVLLALISGLAAFTSMIPEFAKLFQSKDPYADRYLRVKGKRHVIICGHITSHSLAPFLRDFLHEGRYDVDDLDVLIMDKKTPDIEMEALLKQYYTKLHYFVGSIMNIVDLQRIQVDKATACLIIANKECADSNSDDSANIMRVISLKNFNHRIRILLQLLRYINKLNVVSIPGWSVDNDEIICISELKLGLIGMSCVVPGFATMITNIFRMSSYNAQALERTKQVWPWRDLYHRGAGMKLYLEDMPPSFYGKSFIESALICFKLRVMLFAVEIDRMIIDVITCDNCVILHGSRAFIVCISNEEANRVKYYCSICYPVLDDLTEVQLKQMRKCIHMEQMDNKDDREISIVRESLSFRENEHSVVEVVDTELTQPLISSQIEQIETPCRNHCRTLPKEDISNFDSTGMFYFTQPRSIDEAILNTDVLRMYCTTSSEQNISEESERSFKHPLHFQDHIIVCLHADQSSSTIGLRNFVLPLRASSFQRHELPTIIFATDRAYMEHEWDALSTFPDIYILNGSPINPYNLKLISIEHCRQCVIMSTLDRGNLDTYLVDKSSVLCALTIRQIQLKEVGLLSQHSLLEKNKPEQSKTRQNIIPQKWIRTLTTLTIDSNVQYVEQGHTEEVDLQFFLTTPFASGTAFADSVLDCILSCAYYNVNTVNLLRNILVGGIDPQLDDILVEGIRFTPCKTSELLKKRRRARMTMVTIRDLISDIDTRLEPVTFSSLFCDSLQHHRVLVMGIYRLLDVLLENDPNWRAGRSLNDQKRIVIYFPPYNYHMDRSDMVYVMQHSHLQDD